MESIRSSFRNLFGDDKIKDEPETTKPYYIGEDFTDDTSFWVPTSNEDLLKAEQRMMEECNDNTEHSFVKLPSGSQIHTTKSINNQVSTEGIPPLVLLHGFGGGVGLWCKNLVPISKYADVYAIDLLGFGRSSRPEFVGKTPEEAQAYWVDSLEEWRVEVGIESMQLLGHSLGGYIAGNYAAKHPLRVEKLILVCPFGTKQFERDLSRLSFLWSTVKNVIVKTSPQSFIRFLGPFGPSLLRNARGNYDNGRYGFDDTRASDYIYHLSAGPVGSGDYAFMALIDDDFVIRDPLINSFHKFTMPVHLIYGGRDPIVRNFSEELIASLSEVRKYADYPVHVLENASHHPYATDSEHFHHILGQILL